MRIRARCETCGREFLLSQIGPESDAPGRCPFCGARFARHYSSVLVDSVANTEARAAEFLHALRRLQAIETGFDIDLEGLLKELEEQVRSAERPAAS